MLVEERHWVQAQALLDTILQVQTEASPEAALHLVVQHTLTFTEVYQSGLLLKEPRTGHWKPVLWAGEGSVERFNPAHTNFSMFLEHYSSQTQDGGDQSAKLWEAQADAHTHLTAAPLYLNQRLAGVLACASRAPFDVESRNYVHILAHIASTILANSQHARINKFTIEEKTKSDFLRSNLIALSSHEMRTPLSVILGYADLLRDIGSDDLQEHVQAVRNSGKNLLDTVNTMTNLMDVLGANVTPSATKPSLLSERINSIESVNNIYLSIDEFNEIYCDIILISSAIKIIADESSRETFIVVSKENQGTRIDIDVSFENQNSFLEHLNMNNSYFINPDKFNQDSFISAFKVTNIVSMHEGKISCQKSPTSEGTLITIWLPDLPLSRFNY